MNHAPRPLALLALLLAAPAAQAIEFTQFQPVKSSLSFVSKQMNVPVDGRFTSFRAKLAFDPAKPAAARAELEIDLASIDAGSKNGSVLFTSRASIFISAPKRTRINGIPVANSPSSTSFRPSRRPNPASPKS